MSSSPGAAAKLDRAAESSFVAVARAWARARNFMRFHPFYSLGTAVATVGAIWYYEIVVTHGNRVPSLAHEHEYEMVTQPSELERRHAAKRVKAMPMMSPREIADHNARALQEAKEREKLRSAILAHPHSEASARKLDGDDLKQQQQRDAKLNKPSYSTLFVTSGHLQEKEGTWNLRNMERNWSILAQDQFKQKDDYHYRLERSKDDDYARQGVKAQQSTSSGGSSNNRR